MESGIPQRPPRAATFICGLFVVLGASLPDVTCVWADEFADEFIDERRREQTKADEPGMARGERLVLVNQPSAPRSETAERILRLQFQSRTDDRELSQPSTSTSNDVTARGRSRRGRSRTLFGRGDRQYLIARNAPPMIGDAFGTSGSSSIRIFGNTVMNSIMPGPPGNVVEVANLGAFFQTAGGTTDTYQFSIGPAYVGGPRVTVDNPTLVNAKFQMDALAPIALQEDPALIQRIADFNAVHHGPGITTFDKAVLQGGTHITPLTGRDIIESGVTDADTWIVEDKFFFQPIITLNVPSPAASGGGVVGRVKIAENTSPIPQDRFFFNYSYFNNVPLIAGGVDVNRFSPGFEKTFQDGLLSVEVRAPFATTLDTSIVAGGITNSDELVFGNVSASVKALLGGTEFWAFSIGLQATAPTANDLRVFTPGGVEQVRVENESVHLMPFLGGLFTPNNNFFVQGFVQLDYDANGNPVLINLDGTGLTNVGRADDALLLFVDLSAGYWLFRNDGPDRKGLTGAAGILELHYNRSLQTTDVVQSGLFRVGNFVDNFEVLNFVVGTTLTFGAADSLTIGYSTPLAGGVDEQFDGELRVFYIRYFGS